MSYTKYGEYIRILRIKYHEVMGDLANVLDTSLPFMSAVENGKKNVPSAWIPKIIEHYNLNSSEIEELNDAVEESKTQMKLNLINTSGEKRIAALQFARSFEDMDDETARSIMEILERNSK